MRKRYLFAGAVLLVILCMAALWRSSQKGGGGEARQVELVAEGVEIAEAEGEGGRVNSNLILNGSFEEGFGFEIRGWRKVGKESPGIYAARGYKGANATHGRQALDVGVQGMGGGNEVSQEVATKPGVTYSLSFDWGSEYAWGVLGEVVFQDGVTNITLALEDQPRVDYPRIDETPDRASLRAHVPGEWAGDVDVSTN